MTDCCDRHRGEPVSRLGYGPAELAVLAIVRHYCSSFAMPDRQGWIAAISAALSHFGDERGPETAVAVLASLQALRRSRRSQFCFNAAGCPSCSAFVTGHERLFMNALRAVMRGRMDAALAHATLLCEGNDASALVKALQMLVERSLALRPAGADAGAHPLSRSTDPVPLEGS
jgi:hypothetical protein